ncbi:MAG: hypothetical protein ABNO52_00960 [Candidatus Shikimatogenerans sp. Tser]|uniref:DNA helicase n=1 Tax=Candidatus Shikimatogenerans sp. Tser TaxID=3158568 RepID=A0AAU7QQB8_9FLAO
MNINIYNSFAGTGKTFNLIKKFLFISIKNKKYNNIILSYTNYSINNIFNKILKNLKDLINYNKKNKILLYLLKKNIKYNKIKKKSIKILKKIFINNNIITLDKFIYNIIIYKTPKIRIQKKYNILNKIDIYIFKYIKLYNNIFNKKNLFFKIKKKINYLLIFKNLINNIYYINNINYVINIFNKYKIVKKKKNNNL